MADWGASRGEAAACLHSVPNRSTGVAVCDKKVLHNVLVELYEKDTMNPDDLLAHIHTNANGEFQLYGEHDEAGYIRPYLRVRHNCHAKPNCARIAEYQIPQSALGDVYDMTFLTLDIKVAGETEGIAVCQKKRLSNVKIELWDRDTLDPNDLLSTVFTNGDGEFTITGGEDEVGKIEPFIRVTHNCKTKPYCQRIGDFEVPQEKIDGTYDMTYLTLDIAVSGEKEKCM
ncbi:unnamed protein product, partial [Mesorhabditis spiculigera]